MEYTLNLTACDTSTKLTKATSMFFIGYALGPYFTGFIADRHGRKTALLIVGYSLAFVIFCSNYVKNCSQFGVANFLTGVFANGYCNVKIILVQEQVPSDQRHLPAALLCVWFGIGTSMLGGFFRIFPIWSDYYRAMGVLAFVLMMILHYFGVESSRWLALNDPEKVPHNRKLLDRFRTEEARREVDEELKIIEINNTENRTKQDFLKIFRSKMFLKRMFLTTIIWTLSEMNLVQHTTAHTF